MWKCLGLQGNSREQVKMAYEVVLAVAEHNELDFDWEQHLEPEFFKASSIAVVVFVFFVCAFSSGF